MADKQRWADRSADRRQGKGKWHRGGTVKRVKQEVETGGDVFMYCTYVLMACSLFHLSAFIAYCLNFYAMLHKCEQNEKQIIRRPCPQIRN